MSPHTSHLSLNSNITPPVNILANIFRGPFTGPPPRFSTRAIALSLGCIVLSGCFAPKYTDSEKEITETLSGENYQPATREFRNNVETQDLLTQAAFWSREHNLNPGDLEAAIKLASAVRRMGNPAQAIEITQQTRALYPRDPYLAAEYSAALIASERGVDAIDTLDTALRTAPGYARLWSLKGAALDQMEQYDLARKHYAKALQITPYDPSILANVGLSYALSGDVATGETWLRRAVEIPGAGTSVRQNLAIILQLQGKDDEADSFLPGQRSANLTPPALPRPQTQASRPTQAVAPQAQPHYRAPSRPQQYTQPAPPTSPRTVRPQTTPDPRAPRFYGSQTHTTQAAKPNYAPTYTSNYMSNGQNVGQYTSASEAARAAAKNIQERKMTGRFVEPVQNTTTEQQSILDKLSQSLGPRPSTGLPSQARQNYTAPQAQYQAQPHIQGQPNGTYQRQPYTAPRQAAPAYGAPQYSQQQPRYVQQPQYQQKQPTPRGAARRR